MRRLLFYCHHLSGLGHVARSLLIAQAALELGDCECSFVIAGKPVRGLAWDARMHVWPLPAMALGTGGRLVAVDADDEEEDVVRRRGRLLRELLERERPHAVLVDYTPLGLGGELVETLGAAARDGWATRFVWGLPYAEDAARERPRNPRLRQALDAYYGVLGYSDETWIDLFGPYSRFGLPPHRAYVGVVAARPLPRRATECPVVLGYCGSGYGGAELFELLLAAVAPLAQAGEVRVRFVAGVANAREAFERGFPNVEIVGEAPIDEAARDATVVVARCGYNSAYMLAQTDLPLIFVPLRLAQSVTEQYERAQWLSRLDGITWVDEMGPDPVAALRHKLEDALGVGRVARALPFRTDGAANAARWLLEGN